MHFAISKMQALAFFFALVAVAAGADPPMVDMLFKPSNSISLLNRHVVGVNSYLMRTNIKYTHPGLQPWLKTRGVQALRWPGGTPSNYHDWESGKAVQPLGFDTATIKSREQISSRINALTNALTKSRRSASCPVTELKRLKRFDGVVNIVVNICANSPEKTRRLAEKVKKFGIKKPYFEMGNEVYFSSYDFCVIDGNRYSQIAESHADAIRSVLPNAKIAAAVSSAVYTKEDFLGAGSTSTKKVFVWNRQLARNQGWFDAVTVHLYSSLGKNINPQTAPFEKMYTSAISHADNRTSDALAILRNQFPRKETWITEWHVGGFSDEFNGLTLRDTWFGGLYATQVFLKYITNPSVQLTSYHSLTKTIFIPKKEGAGQIAENYLDDDIQAVPSNAMPLDIFGPIVKKCSSVTEIIFKGASRYRGGSEYPGLYPELSGVVFQCGSRRGHVVVINKREKEYLLKKLSLETIGNHKMKLRSGYMLGPQNLKSDAVNRRNIPRSELTAGAVRLDPFSIAVFQLSM